MGGIVRGPIAVAGGRGDIEFASSGDDADELPLDFDPLGALVQVAQGSTIVLTGTVLAGAPGVSDGATGLPILCMDAAVLTAIRTAASTAAASRVLARPDSAVLAILGLGEQAHSHIEAMRAVHPITRIIAWGRDRAKLEAFAQENGAEMAGSAAAAVAQADIIVTATPAREPFLSAAMLKPGQHVNAVGASVAFMQELSADVVAATRYVTDYRPSLEPQAAEVIAARKQGLIAGDHDIPEIGEIIAGAKPGRRSADDITLYRSLGIAAQDLAAAHFILARAVEGGVGSEIDMT